MNANACIVCGSKNAKPLFRGKDRLHRIDNASFSIVRCAVCGLAFLDPQPSPEVLRRYYPEQYGAYQDDDEIFRYGPIMRLMRRYAHRRTRDKVASSDLSVRSYLDFGCGGGRKLESVRAAHPHWELYGLDNNPHACAQTARKGFQVFCEDARPEDLPDDFFDIIEASHVIEHVPDPRGMLARIRTALKEDGTLTVSTPNFNSLAARLFRSTWYALDTPRHLFLFSSGNLTRLLEETGFYVERVEFDPGPKVALRSLAYLFGKKDLRINPIVWRLAAPASRLLAAFGSSSIMTVHARKKTRVSEAQVPSLRQNR